MDKEKLTNSKKISIILTILLVGVIIWIVLIKQSNAEEKILAPVIVGIVILIFLSFSLFGKFITKKLKEASKNTNKKVLTEEDFNSMIYKIVEGTSEKDFKDGMFRNVKRIEPKMTKEVDGDEIYAVLVRLSYPIKFGGEEEDGLWIVVNATHPNIMPSILKEKTEKLEEEMNYKSKNYRTPKKTIETAKNEALGFESMKETIEPIKEEGEEVI